MQKFQKLKTTSEKKTRIVQLFSRVVILLCGGNIDITVLGRCIDRGLAAEGRLVKITVQTPDQPGGMSSVVNIISELGGSIKDVHQERAWVTTSAFQVQVISILNREYSRM